MKKYKWGMSDDTEQWNGGDFDTIEECVKEAIILEHVGIGDVIYVGEVTLYDFSVDAYSVLDCLADDAYDDVGDIANGWPYYGSNETLDDLSDDLTNCVKNWLIKRNNMPNFYKITNIREVKIDEKLVE